MVKIRMARHGAKKRPYYHIVVANSESPRDGRFLEQLGVYDPSKPDDQTRLDLDRVDYWLTVGARPSTRVKRLINVLRRKPAEPEAEVAPNAAPKADTPKADAPKAEADAPKAEAAPDAEPKAEPAAEAEAAPEAEAPAESEA